ncbi:hypothetical protein J2Z64_002222 [Oceanobacillus polygoni]|uniref:Uncharacterized protein n=1 Tax=Oceanobacillus polygoni TaxID=1235259 RepID=A0A9X1CHT9_9BACI|nr:hypothetical protein [Oceanobacillus polygoni]
MKKPLCGLLLVLLSFVGYRIASDYLEDNREFR